VVLFYGAGFEEAVAAPATTQARSPLRWEKAIAAFEERDKANPPPRNGVLFIGSSTIGGWKTLASDYPGAPVINRGFGGSEIVDATHYADRIVIPYAPKIVFLRSGGNDIHFGKSADEVFNDFKGFVAKVHSKLPDTPIVFIGQSPAPVRWSERETNRKLNKLVEGYARENAKVKYVECYDMTVDAEGNPREELFVKDRLHFNAEGYKLLADRVRPFVPTKK
jgi:lysophospholipase L1-like esterase